MPIWLCDMCGKNVLHQVPSLSQVFLNVFLPSVLWIPLKILVNLFLCGLERHSSMGPSSALKVKVWNLFSTWLCSIWYEARHGMCCVLSKLYQERKYHDENSEFDRWVTSKAELWIHSRLPFFWSLATENSFVWKNIVPSSSWFYEKLNLCKHWAICTGAHWRCTSFSLHSCLVSDVPVCSGSMPGPIMPIYIPHSSSLHMHSAAFHPDDQPRIPRL